MKPRAFWQEIWVYYIDSEERGGKEYFADKVENLLQRIERGDFDEQEKRSSVRGHTG
jgi:hypothetical protein